MSLFSNVLKMIVCEYPNCLDLEFVENFLETINEKFEVFKANFHPITHIESNDKSILS